MRFCLLCFSALALLGVPGQGGKTALMIVDVQDCFLDAAGTASGKPGSLEVANTTQILPIINQIRNDKSCLFDVVVRSQDYHTVNHISFGPTHGLPPFAHLLGKGPLPITCIKPSSGLASDSACCPSYYIRPYDCSKKLCPNVTNMSANQTKAVLSSPACRVCNETTDSCFETTQAMWTIHCLMTADGDAGFPPSLEVPQTDIVVRKGNNEYVDSYSAFLDNSRKLYTPLHKTLQDLNVTTLYLMGIALDYTVYFTCIDALHLGYTVYLVQDATRYISKDTAAAALADMVVQGANVISSQDVFNKSCSSAQATATAIPQASKEKSSAVRRTYFLSVLTLALGTYLL